LDVGAELTISEQAGEGMTRNCSCTLVDAGLGERQARSAKPSFSLALLAARACAMISGRTMGLGWLRLLLAVVKIASAQ
jgi:hypothetical protein